MVPAAFMPWRPQASLSTIAKRRPLRRLRLRRVRGFRWLRLYQPQPGEPVALWIARPERLCDRDWGRFFGITADGAYYRIPISTPDVQNSTLTPRWMRSHRAGCCTPTSSGVRCVFPGIDWRRTHRRCNASPNTSFAAGRRRIDYKLVALCPAHVGRRHRLVVCRAGLSCGSGNACTTTSNCSAHERRNSRASFGLVYKF